MKLRKLLALLLAVLMLATALVACSTEAPVTDTKKDDTAATDTTDTKDTTDTAATDESTESTDKALKIGWAMQDMTNPIFAAASKEFETLCKEKGWEVTELDCQNNSATQISQVENLVASDIDVLVIYPVEVNALEDVCQKAHDAGVKVFSWDFDMEAADMCWLVYNYDLGQMIGSEAAKWANEHYPDGCEIAVLDYAILPVIVERANGIVDAIKEQAPNCTIVAQDSAVNVAEGMSVAENMLQAHPDIKVFACIGDGGAVGANEALKASGANLDEYGCFGADASDEALAAIKNNEAVRMSVTLGSGKDFAEAVAGYIEQLMGGTYERIVYKTMTPVDASNVDEYYSGN